MKALQEIKRRLRAHQSTHRSLSTERRILIKHPPSVEASDINFISTQTPSTEHPRNNNINEF